jgi:hypothetical protein
VDLRRRFFVVPARGAQKHQAHQRGAEQDRESKASSRKIRQKRRIIE